MYQVVPTLESNSPESNFTFGEQICSDAGGPIGPQSSCRYALVVVHVNLAWLATRSRCRSGTNDILKMPPEIRFAAKWRPALSAAIRRPAKRRGLLTERLVNVHR